MGQKAIHKGILIVAVLFAALSLVQYDQSFWAGFWPNFLADLLVALIVTYLFAKIIEGARHRDAEVHMTIDTRIEKEIWLEFSLVNTGKEKYLEREIYWHVYINIDTVLDNKSAVGVENIWGNPQIIKGAKFNQFSGLIDAPVFPQRQIDVFRIKFQDFVNTQQDESNHAFVDRLKNNYYRLSTAYGLIPDSGNAKQIDPDVLLDTQIRKIPVFRS